MKKLLVVITTLISLNSLAQVQQRGDTIFVNPQSDSVKFIKLGKTLYEIKIPEPYLQEFKSELIFGGNLNYFVPTGSMDRMRKTPSIKPVNL